MSENPLSETGETAKKPMAIQPIVGRADHRLDPKRRFTIPSDWYTRMGSPAQVYVMPSLSRMRCLDVFCPSEFDKRMESFRTAALSDVTKTRFVSRIGEIISCCSLDTQNRIRVKDSLLAYTGIQSDVVLIGSGFHIEVWSLENRPKLDGTESTVVDLLADEALSLGF